MIRVRHVIQLPLAPRGPVTHRILLWRTSGRGFTDREQMLLTLVRPHLDAVHEARLRRLSQGRLTERQLDLLRQVAAGLDNRQIARHLAISEATVRTHLQNIYSRLGVSSRTAAIATVFPPGLD
jgi:DNA-binding NarL/FixJ family response regulator